MRSYFSDVAKNALVSPIYEKKDRQNKENHCPVNILNGFSKVYERFINDSMLPIRHTFLSNFVSTYRKHYSENHDLLIAKTEAYGFSEDFLTFLY